MTAQGKSIDSARSASHGLQAECDVPNRLLESAERLFALAKAGAPRRRVELYARATIRVRARREASDVTILDTGRDEGLAVRTQDEHGRVRFAAASGIEPAAMRVALAGATGDPGIRIALPWQTGGRGVQSDHAASGPSPGSEDLERWLRECAPAGRPAWVESGRTVETLVADGGLLATRTRDRVWAVAMVDRAGEERPRIVAGRTLDRLDPAGLAPSPYPGMSPIDVRDVPRHLPWIAEPADAAILVQDLVTALCGPEAGASVPVGRGFSVTEDPHTILGLAGGSFDDAGFPTRVNLLTDQGFTIPVARGPGSYRRDSFRDPPHVGFGTLVVPDGTDELPEDAIRIEGLRVSRLAPDRWNLEFGGVYIAHGSPARSLVPTGVTIRPVELVRRIRGAVGTARTCSNGVVTPILILDPLV